MPIKVLLLQNQRGFNSRVFGDRKFLNAFPNPVSATTTIDYTLATSATTSLIITNAIGVIVATPIAQQQQIGGHHAALDTRGFPAGVYWCTLRSGSVVKTVGLRVE